MLRIGSSHVSCINSSFIDTSTMCDHVLGYICIYDDVAVSFHATQPPNSHYTYPNPSNVRYTLYTYAFRQLFEIIIRVEVNVDIVLQFFSLCVEYHISGRDDFNLLVCQGCSGSCVP